jgi:hypothetical protein
MRQRVQLYQQPASLNLNNGSLAGFFLLISSKVCRQNPTMAMEWLEAAVEVEPKAQVK